MENTLENKAKFFAQYLNQHIVKWHKRNCKKPAYLHFSLLDEKHINSKYLELKPLSSISDEDAIDVIGKELYYHYRNDENDGRFGTSASFMFLEDESFHINEATAVDVLRSKGYALPYMGVSIEELVNRGWVKLKEVSHG